MVLRKSAKDKGANIIEYCIRSSYLEREDLLSCQASNGKLHPLWKKSEKVSEFMQFISKKLCFSQKETYNDFTIATEGIRVGNFSVMTI